MAVLAEGISVILQADALLRAFDDDFERFKEMVPNQTLCADGELARVGFMAPDDVQAFVRELERFGLRFIVDDKAQDVAVVDQMAGPTVDAPWLQFGTVGWDGDETKRVACCRLKGSTSKQVVTPEGWEYERSLSSSFLFVPEEHVDSLTVVKSKDGVDEIRTPLSPGSFYLGRAFRKR